MFYLSKKDINLVFGTMATLQLSQKTIISKKEIPNIVSAELTSENIIEVKWNSTIDEIEKQHLVHLKNIIEEIGLGKKMLIYVDTYNFMAITTEARLFASSPESSEFTLANAVLIDSLAKKLIFNFFMNISKPVVPTKGFNSKEEAINWLKSQSL